MIERGGRAAGAERRTVSSLCSECGAPVVFEAGADQVRCEHCQAGLVVGAGHRLIRLQCPSCAGNFYYLDGRMSGRCPFCDAALLALIRARLLRFVIPPTRDRRPEGAEELWLLPFWRLTGLLFGWDFGVRIERPDTSGLPERGSGGEDPTEMAPSVSTDSGPQKLFRGRVVERLLPDAASVALGVQSLRLRPQLFSMEPFAEEHSRLGRVVPPEGAATEMRERLFAVAMDLGTPRDGLTRLDAQRADLLAESMSLLYYPFWLREAQGTRKLWDAVTGLPEQLAPPRPAKRPESPSAPAARFASLKVLTLRCGECGEDLSPGGAGVVFPCTGCGRFWVAGESELEPFVAHTAESSRRGENLRWLPYWRVEVVLQYGGAEARTVSDLRRVLGVALPPGATESSPLDEPLRYYAPAFGALQAPRLDFAGRDLTRWQPRLVEAVSTVPGERFACFFGPDDARRLAYVLWLQLLPGALPRKARTLRVATREVELWYLPFAEGARELESLLTGTRYDRSTFRGVRH
ncbi:MAG: hypothetical protein IT371_10540 [Deltaproteobacteria bacterium]|nr:hypothetical protein [Deltaproteobacteria bacterium]